MQLNHRHSSIQPSDMCIFTYSMCDKCLDLGLKFRFNKNESVCCGMSLCGRCVYFQMGSPIDMDLNVGNDYCPCGEFCYNVYKYYLLCFDHRSLDKEDLNGEISDCLHLIRVLISSLEKA